MNSFTGLLLFIFTVFCIFNIGAILDAVITLFWVAVFGGALAYFLQLDAKDEG